MIYAKFTVTSAEVTTKPVKQWDYGRVLRIQGLKLPAAVRIDFGIVGAQTTISRIGTTKDGATDVVIPDSLLEQPKNLVAYVYVSNTTEGKTVATINIPIEERAKPEEYDTPESKELFAEAIEAVNVSASRAEKAAEEAEASADSVKESLESTQRIAESFGETATQAVKNVNDAGTAQIQAINKTKEDALQAIQQEGAGQVKAVQDEASFQLDQIQTAGENIVEASATVEQNVKNVMANAIKGHLSGEVVMADDVSNVEHEMNVKVCGKNIVNVATMVSTVASNNFVSNEDGTYTLTKATDGSSIKRFSASSLFLTPIKANTPFKISCDLVENTSEDGLYIALYDQGGEAVAYPAIPTAENKVFLYNKDICSVRVYLLASEIDGTYVIIKNLQIELGNEKTEYKPYIDPTTVQVTAGGKTYTPNVDGTVDGILSSTLAEGISTDTEDVVIDCEYIVDTKTYIDRKFEELKTSMNA